MKITTVTQTAAHREPELIGEKLLTEKFTDPQAAVDRVIEIYEHNTAILRDAFKQFAKGEVLQERVRACYPFVRITTEKVTHTDTRQSFGFVAGPGTYQTTLTRPTLFKNYLLSQFKLLLANHQEPLEIGVSDLPIPVHFAFAEGIHVEGDLDRIICACCRTSSICPTWPRWMIASSTAPTRWTTAVGAPASIRWPCSPRRASIIRCIACAITRRPRRNSSSVMCCSPTTRFTLMSSCAWDAS